MKPFRCQQCTHIFGRTDGRRLVCGIEQGGAFVPIVTLWRETPLHCPQCQAVNIWRRTKLVIVKPEVACYNS